MLLRITIIMLALCAPQWTAAQVQPANQARLEVWLGVIDKEGKGELRSMRRGAQGVAGIKLKNCKPDAAGNCNTEADLKIINPKGEVDVEQPRVPLWKGKAPAAGELVTGVVFGISVEPNDPIGPYTIEAVVRDLNSGEGGKVSYVLNITQ